MYTIAYKQGSVRAANHLGIMFKKGLGTTQNDKMAYELFLESVSRPDTPEIADNPSYRGTAYYWLGYMTERGEGVKRDSRAAKRWYQKGAACNQPHCLEAIKRLAARGIGERCRQRQD